MCEKPFCTCAIIVLVEQALSKSLSQSFPRDAGKCFVFYANAVLQEWWCTNNSFPYKLMFLQMHSDTSLLPMQLIFLKSFNIKQSSHGSIHPCLFLKMKLLHQPFSESETLLKHDNPTKITMETFPKAIALPAMSSPRLVSKVGKQVVIMLEAICCVVGHPNAVKRSTLVITRPLARCK